MDEILSLSIGDSIVIETAKLPEFFEYVFKLPDLYSFRYDYFEDKVRATLTDTSKSIIIKLPNNEQT